MFTGKDCGHISNAIDFHARGVGTPHDRPSFAYNIKIDYKEVHSL